MMLLYIIMTVILIFINPILGAVGLLICICADVLKSIISKNDSKKETQNRSDSLDDMELEEINWELDDIDSKKNS